MISFTIPNPELVESENEEMIKPKMATEIPSAITMPDLVETRLGTLRFTDGFPDDATVEKVSPGCQVLRRGSSSIPTRLWMFTSGRRRRQERKATGCRPGPARAGPSFFVSTVRCNRSSTGRGDPARLKK